MHGIRWVCCIVILALGAFAAEPPSTPSTMQQADAQKQESSVSTASKPAYPNIILVTMDTTRADRMGFLGSERGLTPNLDALAKESAVFTRAYSQAPLTPASHATILSGTYPQYHQVFTFPNPLGKDIPYLPEILKAKGYTTAAFLGSLALSAAWGAPGFDRGFDTYDANYSWKGYSPATRYQTVENRAGDVVARALAWAKSHQPGPFFLWVHVFDPHEPYDPPEPYKTRYAKAPYDGEIAYTDSALGTFFQELKTMGLFDGALIALTADHGESLGAHGEDTHGIFIYDETVHVPLLIKLPRAGSAGRRIEIPVELADITPTILARVGIDMPKQVQGSSLLDLMKSGPEDTAAEESWRDRGAYSQGDYGRLAFAWSELQALRTGKYLFIQAPHRELYDARLDGKAEHNLAASSPAVADTLAARMQAFLQKTTSEQEAQTSHLTDAQMKQLVMLGYMPSRGDAPSSAPGAQGADPKDKIAVGNVIVKFNNMLRDFRCEGAEPEIKKALVKLPDVAMLHSFLGGCYMEDKDYEKAVPEYRKAVQLDPGFTRAEMNLGTVLMYTREYTEAITAFEHVAKADPQNMNAQIFLIVAYGKTDRPQDVIRACRTVLATIPDNYGANVNLGRALAQTGDFAGAVAPLQNAISALPNRPDAHVVLAQVYQQLGKEEDAKRELDEAQRLGSAHEGQPGPSPAPVAPEKQ